MFRLRVVGWRELSIISMVSVCLANVALGGTFSDSFDTTASTLWRNELGNWSSVAGVYRASAPDNFPNAHSSLPFDLTDFTVDVDVTAADGGVWLRSQSSLDGIGRTGVLLVTLPNSVYWHNVQAGSYGGILSAATPPSTSYALTVDVAGNTYSAYANGTPLTTLSLSDFSHGEVALYSNSGNQTFDNFVIRGQGVPEPSTAFLLGSFSALLGVVFRRRGG